MTSKNSKLRRELEAQHMVIAAKMSIPVVIFVLLALAMLVVLWSVGSVEDWKSETVRYSHQGSVKVPWSRSASKEYDALVAMDGRIFVVTDADAVFPKLQPGEVCEIVYLDAFFQAMYLRGLSTEEDGDLILQEDFIAVHRQNQRELWLIIAGAGVLALVVMGMIWLLGCRKQKAAIRAIKARMAKLDARAARHKEYQTSQK